MMIPIVREKFTDRQLDRQIKQIIDTLNAILRYQTLAVEFGDAGVEKSASHSLNKAPDSYQVIDIDKAGIVYKGTTDWTNETVYFKCSVSDATARIRVWKEV